MLSYGKRRRHLQYSGYFQNLWGTSSVWKQCSDTYGLSEMWIRMVKQSWHLERSHENHSCLTTSIETIKSSLSLRVTFQLVLKASRWYDNTRQISWSHSYRLRASIFNHDERDGTSNKPCLASSDNRNDLNNILRPGILSPLAQTTHHQPQHSCIRRVLYLKTC